MMVVVVVMTTMMLVVVTEADPGSSPGRGTGHLRRVCTYNTKMVTKETQNREK